MPQRVNSSPFGNFRVSSGHTVVVILSPDKFKYLLICTIRMSALLTITFLLTKPFGLQTPVSGQLVL